MRPGSSVHFSEDTRAVSPGSKRKSNPNSKDDGGSLIEVGAPKKRAVSGEKSAPTRGNLKARNHHF